MGAVKDVKLGADPVLAVVVVLVHERLLALAVGCSGIQKCAPVYRWNWWGEQLAMNDNESECKKKKKTKARKKMKNKNLYPRLSFFFLII